MQAVPEQAESEGFRAASGKQAFVALEAKYLRKPPTERRREPRHPLHTNVRLWLDDATKQDCATIDLSQDGVGVFCQQYIQPGTEVRIGFPSLDERLLVKGVVRESLYLDGAYHHIGIEFEAA